MSLTKYRERMGIPNDVDDDVAFNIFKSGGEVIISKVVENGVDLCPHEWEEIEEKREISRGLGCKVYRCIKGCLRFVFRSRSSLGKWLWGYRSLPKIPGKLPTEGYYSDDWFHRKFGMNPQTVSDYYKLTEGLDINGVPAYIKTDDGRFFYYRDDPSPLPHACMQDEIICGEKKLVKVEGKDRWTLVVPDDEFESPLEAMKKELMGNFHALSSRKYTYRKEIENEEGLKEMRRELRRKYERLGLDQMRRELREKFERLKLARQN